MEPTYIKGLGVIQEVSDVDYHSGRKKLAEINADFSKMTARNTAYARTKLPLDHDFNTWGNWILEEVIYTGAENPILSLGKGPIFYNPGEATNSHRNGEEFSISRNDLSMPEELSSYENRWDSALEYLLKDEKRLVSKGKLSPLQRKLFELPHNESFEIPVEELLELDMDRISEQAYFETISKEAQVAVMLFKDQTKEYAEKTLKAKGITEIPFWLRGRDIVSKEDYSSSRAMWLLGLGGRSGLGGNDSLVYGSRARGVQQVAEGSAKIPSEFDTILEQIMSEGI